LGGNGKQVIKVGKKSNFHTDYTEKKIKPQITQRSKLLRFARRQPMISREAS